MNVSIHEHSFSLASTYDIATPKGDYKARKKIFSFTDNIELTTSGGAPVAQIEGEISPLRHKHTFVLHDGRTYQFECEKLLKQVFTCEGNGETYRLYSHRGLNYSIFKEDRQIAAFTKNRLVLGSGNEYEIRVDSDADVVVLVCMILTYNSSEEDSKDDSAVTLDIGHLGPQDRKFDEAWEPR